MTTVSGAKEGDTKLNVSQVWQSPLFARTVGASYDWAIERKSVARRFGRVVTGADVDRVYQANGRDRRNT
ncbi:hypothetical protein MINTM021_11830 [Mycobacterium paraintracellulare]|nr:hypothetical protein MINTM021_11830 [Mycobacterium paraintracellulare]